MKNFVGKNWKMLAVLLVVATIFGLRAIQNGIVTDSTDSIIKAKDKDKKISIKQQESKAKAEEAKKDAAKLEREIDSINREDGDDQWHLKMDQ